MPGFIDRHRAAKLMAERGLDALVLAQPESITYATGAFPGVATYWRRAGAAFVLVPADAEAPLAAIVGDLQAASFAAQSAIADTRSHRIWVESSPLPERDTASPRRAPRPAQFDLTATVVLLRDLLSERGYLGGAIGLELGFVSTADFPAFGDVPVTWRDCTNIVERLRAVKSPAEIEHLRKAARYAAAGFRHLAESIEEGMTAARMTDIWRTAAYAEAERLNEPAPASSWAYISVAGDGFAPGGPARPGDLIKIDVGCVIAGYSSDGARTLALGSPAPQAVRIYDSLHRAFDVGFTASPWTPLADIYRATATTMWMPDTKPMAAVISVTASARPSGARNGRSLPRRPTRSPNRTWSWPSKCPGTSTGWAASSKTRC